MKILIYFEKLSQLKEHDPKTYEKLVNHVMILGITLGSIATLWILLVLFLLTNK